MKNEILFLKKPCKLLISFFVVCREKAFTFLLVRLEIEKEKI